MKQKFMFKVLALTALIAGATWWLLDTDADVVESLDTQTLPPVVIVKESPVSQHEKTLPLKAVQTKAEFAAERIAAAARVRNRGLAASSQALSEEFNRLPRSSAVRFNSKSHFVLAARAIPQAQFSPTLGVPLLTQNGFTVVAQDVSKEKDWAEVVVRGGDRPVLANSDNGRAEIVTGTLVIELADVNTAEALAARQNLQLVHVDPAISRAYYKVPEGYHLVPGLAALNRDSAVKSIEVEILHGKVETR